MSVKTLSAQKMSSQIVNKSKVAVRYQDITYTQSSVYGSNVAANYSNMNDNNASGSSGATATASSGNTWVMADLGSNKAVNRIIIGYDYLNNLPGGWGTSYTQNLNIQTSTDASNWTTVGTTPSYSSTGSTNGLVTINFSAQEARYVRLQYGTYFALTEFQVWRS